MVIQCHSIQEWRAGFGRKMFNLDFKPGSDAPFRASFNPFLEGMRIVKADFSAGLTVRSKELARDGDADYGLVIAMSRHLHATQRGREVVLQPGEATVLRVSDPGDVGAHEPFGFMTFMMPFADLEARAHGAGKLVAHRIHRRSEGLDLLRSYVRSAERNWPRISEARRAVIRQHFTDLAALAIMPETSLGESQFSPVVASRLAAALEHIDACFEVPGLSVTDVARRMAVSPRYLQRILEKSGTSFTDRLNEVRLQRAFELLTRQQGQPRRISDIALQVGFSDISHFNRLFRARFGETPRAVRSTR
jgi:AraC-like DNA-binding protein